MKTARGNLFIISAPSGAGKTTLLKALMEQVEGFSFAVSHTTRDPRGGEQDGVDYNFVSRDEFERMIKAGEFVEWAEVHGNYYGTARAMLEAMMATGTDVLHDIDVQGARQIRESGVEATFIYILPPSLEALEQRLRSRGSDAEEVMARRLKNALSELEGVFMYDYVILNDRVERALGDLRSVITATGLRASLVDKKWIKKNFFS